MQHFKADGIFQVTSDRVVSRISSLERNKGRENMTTMRDVVSLSRELYMLGRGCCKECQDIGSSPRSLSAVLL